MARIRETDCLNGREKFLSVTDKGSAREKGCKDSVDNRGKGESIKGRRKWNGKEIHKLRFCRKS